MQCNACTHPDGFGTGVEPRAGELPEPGGVVGEVGVEPPHRGGPQGEAVGDLCACVDRVSEPPRGWVGVALHKQNANKRTHRGEHAGLVLQHGFHVQLEHVAARQLREAVRAGVHPRAAEHHLC